MDKPTCRTDNRWGIRVLEWSLRIGRRRRRVADRSVRRHPHSPLYIDRVIEERT